MTTKCIVCDPDDTSRWYEATHLCSAPCVELASFAIQLQPSSPARNELTLDQRINYARALHYVRMVSAEIALERPAWPFNHSEESCRKYRDILAPEIRQRLDEIDEWESDRALRSERENDRIAELLA